MISTIALCSNKRKIEIMYLSYTSYAAIVMCMIFGSVQLCVYQNEVHSWLRPASIKSGNAGIGTTLAVRGMMVAGQFNLQVWESINCLQTQESQRTSLRTRSQGWMNWTATGSEACPNWGKSSEGKNRIPRWDFYAYYWWNLSILQSPKGWGISRYWVSIWWCGLNGCRGRRGTYMKLLIEDWKTLVYTQVYSYTEQPEFALNQAAFEVKPP